MRHSMPAQTVSYWHASMSRCGSRISRQPATLCARSSPSAAENSAERTHRPADPPQVGHTHFFVLARDDDPVSARLEGFAHTLVHLFGIGCNVCRVPGNVKADARVDFRFALGGGDAASGFAVHVVGRETGCVQILQPGLEFLVVAEQIVVEIQRFAPVEEMTSPHACLVSINFNLPR